MSLWRIFIKEISHRKINFGLGVLAVAVAIGSLAGAQAIFLVYERDSRQILAREERKTEQAMTALREEMRQATLKTSFNLLILPEGQNLKDWRAKDYALEEMPEAYVEKLATSGIVTVRHFLPSLQQKIKWPERNDRTLILIGTRGETPNLHKNPVKPLVEQVPVGTIVLGHELHRSLGLKVGDTVTLKGREFKVRECQEKRGTQDEITAWIHLSEAQEILGKEGLINSILALGCLCAGPEGIERIRYDLAKFLPGTQVVEQGSSALARVEARTKVGKESKALLEQKQAEQKKMTSALASFTEVLVPLIMVVCAVWIALLTFSNVRDRRSEIGILRAMGFRSNQVMALFLSKSLTIGILGGVLGLLAGIFLGGRVDLVAAEKGASEAVSIWGLLRPELPALALAAAVALSLLAGWIPALAAAREDPARTLRKE